MSEAIPLIPSMVPIREEATEKVTTTEIPDVTGGNPVFDSWKVFENDSGRIRSGIWQTSAGAWRSEMKGCTEFCHILDGMVRITDQDGKVNEFTAGDAFVMPEGHVGHWEVPTFVRKHWVIVES